MIDYLLPPQSERHQCCRDDWFYYIYKWLTATKERERERVSMIIAVMTNRLTQLALSLGFEEDLFQTYTTFLTEQYLRDSRARALFSLSHFLSLSLSLSLSRACSRESVVPLQTFYSPVFIFYRNNRRQIVEKKGSHLKCTILRVRGEKCRVYMLSFACVFVFVRVSMCASRQHQTLLLQQLIEIAKRTSRK